MRPETRNIILKLLNDTYEAHKAIHENEWKDLQPRNEWYHSSLDALQENIQALTTLIQMVLHEEDKKNA